MTARFCGHCGAPATPPAAPVPRPSDAAPTDMPWAVTVMPQQARPAVPATAPSAPARRSSANLTAGVRRYWSGLEGRTKLGAAGGVCVLVLVPLTVSGNNPVTRAVVAPTHTLTGTMTVDAFNDDSCDMAGWDASSRLDRLTALVGGQTFPCPNGPGGGYGDLADGTAISVSDGSGKLLATGRLTGGTQKMSGVSWAFSVDDVPQADFYKVQVANRGELPYSRADLEAKDWTVSASLG